MRPRWKHKPKPRKDRPRRGNPDVAALPAAVLLSLGVTALAAYMLGKIEDPGARAKLAEAAADVLRGLNPKAPEGGHP